MHDIVSSDGLDARSRWVVLLDVQMSIPNVQDIHLLRLRILDHWDNLDGSIERGYAGSSLWRWDELPDRLDRRYTDYARACASIGINGSVLNNVNANSRYFIIRKSLLESSPESGRETRVGQSH